jgi:branched-chain amino acid aminotransferase
MDLHYSIDDIAKAVSETVSKNKLASGLVKILVYWSEEMMIGLLPSTKVDLAILIEPENEGMHLDSSEPITACLSKWRKIDPRTVPVEAKACSNYLNAYLARKEAAQRGFDAGIMLDTDDFLAEGSTESVFIIKAGEIQVPPLGRVLASISRMSILDVADNMGLKTIQKPITHDELAQADEMFLSHTGNKAEPICQFEQKRMEAPGPITTKLRHQMQRILTFQDDNYIDWMQLLSNF